MTSVLAASWHQFSQRYFKQADHYETPLDSVLAGIVVVLVCLGLVMVASSSVMVAENRTGDALFYVKRQFIALCLGVSLGVAAYQVRMIWWQRFAPGLLIVAFLLLVLVLVPGIGKTVNYSTRWIPLGIFNLQVSELAKLFAFTYMASYLVRHVETTRQSLMGFIKPLLLFALIGFLVLLQPDMGTTVVLFATGMAMLFIGGVRLGLFVLIGASLVLMAALLTLSTDYRLRRVTSFLDPWADPFGDGFQLIQSLIAVGSGNWFGLGLGNSVQKLMFLPEPHTDFVFSVLAEEFGFIGITLVLLLFVAFVWRAFSISALAEKTGHTFGAHLASGIGIWISLQAFIHIAVDIGALPTKGLTLPFVSYGGSSLMVSCLAAGILLRIAREARLSSAQARRRSA
ncbi:MAG TPA: putative lipid II flippase FtsW [Gammaproteobacteria bacterium]|nr:putative lipid II flippase FtsW [Gammaproteobacteria bacterium]